MGVDLYCARRDRIVVRPALDDPNFNQYLSQMHLFQTSHNIWEDMLDVARAYGWKPAGTILSSEHNHPDLTDRERAEWSGDYHGNEGQLVGAADARAMAAALKEAIKHSYDEAEPITADYIEDMEEFIIMCEEPEFEGFTIC